MAQDPEGAFPLYQGVPSWHMYQLQEADLQQQIRRH